MSEIYCKRLSLCTKNTKFLNQFKKRTKYFYAEYCQDEWYKGQTLLGEMIFMLVDDFEVLNIFPNQDNAGDILFKNRDSSLFKEKD